MIWCHNKKFLLYIVFASRSSCREKQRPMSCTCQKKGQMVASPLSPSMHMGSFASLVPPTITCVSRKTPQDLRPCGGPLRGWGRWGTMANAEVGKIPPPRVVTERFQLDRYQVTGNHFQGALNTWSNFADQKNPVNRDFAKHI